MVRRTLRNQSSLSRFLIKVIYPFRRPPRRIDFSSSHHSSAFLFEDLIFVVTYFYQEKKVNGVLVQKKYRRI